MLDRRPAAQRQNGLTAMTTSSDGLTSSHPHPAAYSDPRRDEVALAITEAWNWLEVQGLLLSCIRHEWHRWISRIEPSGSANAKTRRYFTVRKNLGELPKTHCIRELLKRFGRHSCVASNCHSKLNPCRERRGHWLRFLDKGLPATRFAPRCPIEYPLLGIGPDRGGPPPCARRGPRPVFAGLR